MAVVRKNISLEDAYLKKLAPLLGKHDDNLSAAIREVIDFADAALKRYPSLDKAAEVVSAEKRSLSPRELKIERGEYVFVHAPLFLWFLRWTRGMLPDMKVVKDILEPLRIKTISGLDRFVNELSVECGWKVSVSIYCMDDLYPTTATAVLSGGDELMREFIAQNIALFLAHTKDMDVDAVHRRASSTRIDLKKVESAREFAGVRKHFGQLHDTMNELYARQDFWNSLVMIYRAAGYEMTSVPRSHYEDALAGKVPFDTSLYVLMGKKPITDIPLSEFLALMKQLHEVLGIADRIEIQGENIMVHHSFKEAEAVGRLKEYYLSLLRANGHKYETRESHGVIILTKSQ
ncbi:MAG TPA: hypothetical protein HA257_07265 [Candidatus Methanoperedenaceae archaeon]|nr:hypothetical protein [Candidatus Methanoperedenaceae archaeon]